MCIRIRHRTIAGPTGASHRSNNGVVLQQAPLAVIKKRPLRRFFVFYLHVCKKSTTFAPVLNKYIISLTKQSPEIVTLRADIEHLMGRQMRTPTDFDWLNLRIWDTCHEYLSPTTLKRLWGYIDGAQMPRHTTLSILCRLLGYTSWEEYLDSLSTRHEEESETFAGEGIRTDELHPGDCVEVAWRPNRRAVLRFEGDNNFTIIETENSKLHIGDTCNTVCFLVNRPMYLDNLVQEHQSPKTYVAGKRHGLTYVRKV